MDGITYHGRLDRDAAKRRSQVATHACCRGRYAEAERMIDDGTRLIRNMIDAGLDRDRTIDMGTFFRDAMANHVAGIDRDMDNDDLTPPPVSFDELDEVLKRAMEATR